MQLSVFFDHVLAAARDIGIPAALKKVKDAGIDYLECELGQVFDPALMQLVRDAGLSIGGVYHIIDYAHTPDPAIGYSLVDGAKQAGAKNVLAVPGFCEAGDDPARVMENIARGLTGLVDYGRERGIPVTMEDYDGKKAPYSTLSGMEYFFRAVPTLSCAFDTGNFIYSGEDALRAWHALRGRTIHVHLKDRAFTPRPGDKPKTAVDGRSLYPAPVGSGKMPIAPILLDLAEDGYEGLLAIELFDSGRPMEDIEESAAYLRSFLARA